jgi:hypothetical protein
MYTSGNQGNEEQADVKTNKEQNQLPLFIGIAGLQGNSAELSL